jgi:hypothetical protein
MASPCSLPSSSGKTLYMHGVPLHTLTLADSSHINIMLQVVATICMHSRLAFTSNITTSDLHVMEQCTTYVDVKCRQSTSHCVQAALHSWRHATIACYQSDYKIDW